MRTSVYPRVVKIISECSTRIRVIDSETYKVHNIVINGQLRQYADKTLTLRKSKEYSIPTSRRILTAQVFTDLLRASCTVVYPPYTSGRLWGHIVPSFTVVTGASSYTVPIVATPVSIAGA